MANGVMIAAMRRAMPHEEANTTMSVISLEMLEMFVLVAVKDIKVSTHTLDIMFKDSPRDGWGGCVLLGVQSFTSITVLVIVLSEPHVRFAPSSPFHRSLDWHNMLLWILRLSADTHVITEQFKSFVSKKCWLLFFSPARNCTRCTSPFHTRASLPHTLHIMFKMAASLQTATEVNVTSWVWPFFGAWKCNDDSTWHTHIYIYTHNTHIYIYT